MKNKAKNWSYLISILSICVLLVSCESDDTALVSNPQTKENHHIQSCADFAQLEEGSFEMANNDYEINKSEQQWKEQLTPEQYNILRKKGTEPAFTGQYFQHKGDGVYLCAGCGQPLFDSKTKFDSGTGWPSFWAPADSDNIEEQTDTSLFMKRTEVLCSKCGGHLGHVFNDGPKPTGLRYCINSASLNFNEKPSGSAENEADEEK